MILAPTLSASAGSGAAIARPTFSRDFAGEKTLNNGTGPAITFTRASNATYFNAAGTLTTATTNEPRFDHDPATGASRGLLIEEARTNLYQRSAEFDNAYWTKTRASITANSIAAPDGTTSADLLVEDSTASNSHFVFRQLAHGAANGTITVSVFAKAKERDQLSITFYSGITTPTIDLSGGAVVFNLANGTAGSFAGAATGTASNATGSATITSIGGGWYRCSVTITPNGVSATDAQVYFALHNGTSTSYTGDGTSGLYIWGAQLEAGAFPTSYIPTTTAAATRSADSAVVTPISSFYNQSEGTLFAEASISVYGTPNPCIANLSFASADTNNVFIGYDRANTRMVADGTGISVGSTAITLGQNHKLAVALSSASSRAAMNGALRGSDVAVTLPENPTHLYLGRKRTLDEPLNGYLRKIAYYPKRLSNTLLQQLTT